MDENSLLNLPLYILFVAIIVGLIGNWRRTIAVALFSYAALIIAAQHNPVIADTNLISSLSGPSSFTAKSALALALSTVVAVVLLIALFNLMWGKSNRYSPDYSGLERLLQSLVTGASGWALGVILAICLLTYQGEDLRIGGTSPEATFYASAVNTTAVAVVDLITPWLPDGPPQFLQEWE